jgi:OmpA-OmpF porin, OOP family
MQNNTTCKFFTLLTFMLASVIAFSQSPTKFQHKRWEGGPLFTRAQYQGDLSTTSFKEGFNSGFGLLVRRHLNDNFAIRSSFFSAKLTGNDASVARLKTRGFSFKSPVTDISLMAEYDILGKRRYRNEYFHKIISPYLAVGTALSFINPTTNYNEAENQHIMSKIQEDKALVSAKMLLNLAYGMGVKIDVNNGWALNIEVSKRLTFNDHIDGVSMSASTKKNDTYCFSSVGLIYRFRKKNDKDRDGINDANDFCPNQYGNALLGGCPDRDGDLVPDKDDLCPTEYGDRNLSGCPSEKTKKSEVKVAKNL